MRKTTALVVLIFVLVCSCAQSIQVFEPISVYLVWDSYLYGPGKGIIYKKDIAYTQNELDYILIQYHNIANSQNGLTVFVGLYAIPK